MSHHDWAKKLILLLAVVACSTGCKPTTSVIPPGPVPKSRPVRLISPVPFFAPEQKRLEQHLGWHVGCFKVDYAGPQATLGSRLELWTQGRPEPRGGSSTSSEPDQKEISISVQESTDNANYHVKLAQTSASGGSSTSDSFTKPKLGSWSTRVVKLENPTELRPREEQMVWALMLFKRTPGGSFIDKSTEGESIFDQVKRSDWALVLKVGLNSK